MRTSTIFLFALNLSLAQGMACFPAEGTPDATVLIYAVVYAAVILGLALLSFQRRDL